MKNITLTLKRFNEQANKLNNEKFNIFHKFELSFDFGVSTRSVIKSSLPNPDITKIFLLDLRFFIIKKDNPYNFVNICNLLISENFEIEKVKEFLNLFDNLLKQDSFKLRLDDKDLNNKMIFNTILNEGTFHQELDQKGMNILKQSPITGSIAQVKFFDILQKYKILITVFNKQIVEKYLEINKNNHLAY